MLDKDLCQGLEGLMPVEMAGIGLNGENKWMNLIKIANKIRKYN
jgi:hypothetical protein